MPYPHRVLLAALVLVVGAALFLALPDAPDAADAFRARAEKPERGPDMRPSEWVANQRLFPHWKADPEAYRQALAHVRTMRLSGGAGGFGAWQQAGPTHIGGRISDIEFAPSDPNRVYAAAATGGVFRSDDAGLTWTPVFDDATVLTIGDIAVHPTDPNTVWVGTGEANGSHNNFAGGGVYKSTDGGLTWSFLGLGETYSIGRIRVDPTNPNRIFLAALGAYFGKNEQRGVFRSEDGGQSWDRVLFLSDSTAVIDLAMRPDNPNVLYAAAWERIRRPTGSHLRGPTSGLWRSTDGGDSWHELGPANGLPNPDLGNVGRIGLAISESQPNTMYAYYTNGNSYVGIFRSDDGGDSWTDFDPGRQADAGTSFLWWMCQIRVKPDNPEIVFVLDVPLFRRSAGGTWDAQYGFEVLHVDHHAMAFKPDNPNYILSGNDGGLDLSTDGGLSWTAINGLAITHFYEIGLDAQNPHRLYGGTQDNGTLRTADGSLANWDHILGGDGFYTIVDPTDPNVIYAESQYGNLNKSTNGGASFFSVLNGINGSEPTNWSTPVVMDPNDNRTLYYGTDRVYRTTNGASSWTAISPRLTRNPPLPLINTVTSIAVSPAASSTVWAGTADGKVWVTTNGGTSWTDATRANLPYRWVTRVIADPEDPLVAYVTFSGLKWYEPVPHVFRTADAGQTWQDISTGLPDAPVNALAVDPVNTSVLYLGTDVGAFVSLDRGASWEVLGTGLPAVSVYDLKVHPTERFLAAGTHGRSMWRLDISEITTGSQPGAPAAALRLDAAYPNPFTTSTTLRYGLGVAGPVRVEVYDVLGRRVATLVDGARPAGEHTARLDAGGLAAGAYVVRMEAGGQQRTQTVTLKR